MQPLDIEQKSLGTGAAAVERAAAIPSGEFRARSPWHDI